MCNININKNNKYNVLCIRTKHMYKIINNMLRL